MIQFGSYGELQRAVETFRYKPGWRCWLSNMTHSYVARSDIDIPGKGTFGSGQTVLTGPALLHIEVITADSGGDRPYDLLDRREPNTMFLTHTFSVPMLETHFPPGFTWTRWLLDRILDVERHEAMEFFEVDGRKPFFPDHGGDLSGLYEIREKPREPVV